MGYTTSQHLHSFKLCCLRRLHLLHLLLRCYQATFQVLHHRMHLHQPLPDLHCLCLSQLCDPSLSLGDLEQGFNPVQLHLVLGMQLVQLGPVLHPEHLAVASLLQPASLHLEAVGLLKPLLGE